MAKIYISEYSEMAMWGGSRAPAPNAPALVVQTPIAIGGVSVQSAAFNAETKIIRVHTDAICSVKIDADPTAGANDMRLAADQTEYFGVAPGGKLAVVSNT